MIRILTLLALSVGNVAFAGHCDGDLLAKLESNHGMVKTICVENQAAAKAALTCPRGKVAAVRRNYKSGDQRMVYIACVAYNGATAPPLAISVESSYGSSGRYRSVPQQQQPYAGRYVSTRVTGHSPDYQRVVDATYAWCLMNDDIQNARAQVNANVNSADRALTAEAMLTQERAKFDELEAEYRAHIQRDIDDNKEVK